MKGDDSISVKETPIKNSKTKKRRRRHLSKPSPSTIDLEITKKQCTGYKNREPEVSEHSENSYLSDTNTESDSESNVIMSLPKVSLADDDILRIAQTVKEMLQVDITKTVEREVEEKQKPLIERIEALETKNAELETKLKEMNGLKYETKRLKEKCDDLEQHSRKGLLRFSGVPFDSGENTTAKVVSIVKKIGVDINETDIDVSHRTGKIDQYLQRPRQIIARFRNHELKKSILKSAKKLKEFDDLKGMSINQDLTKTRDEVAYVARKMVRENELTASWVVDGKIFIITKSGAKHVVRRLEILLDIVKEEKFGSQSSLDDAEMNIDKEQENVQAKDQASSGLFD